MFKMFNWTSLITALICVTLTVVYFDASSMEALLIGTSYGIVSQI